MRMSLCNPEAVKYCDEYGPNGHSTLTCYVRYMDFGFEPGEYPMTLEEWQKD